ncbi:DNA adenine methylase [Halomonas denitrificans]|uniref:DNA adenine methylase n=1 Tax=Halomonas denitrificans TaxID=370769 RepID=UPI001C99E4F5|nr:DNA adenine methylase [Halomonas denitrificans]MBY5969931.1 DNA adenine methylase [Halomonas denitrificans]
MSKSSFNSPLRYPGGKGRLTQYVAQLISLNGLRDGAYVEPYAGGAAVAISLLFSEVVRTVHLNDISKPIYSFWYSVLNDTDDLCEMILSTPVTVDVWERQKEIQRTPGCSCLELGFSTFFLNRVNRSGIINGGLIGGRQQSGTWRMDARYNKLDLVSRIRKISKYKNRIKFYSEDAHDFLSEVSGRLGEKTFFYLDPPYYIKGGGLYEHNYKHEDHGKIASFVQEHLSQPWIVSYDNHDVIKTLYSERRQKTFNLHYSANNRFQGKELMVYCDKMLVPEDIVTSRSAVV